MELKEVVKHATNATFHPQHEGFAAHTLEQIDLYLETNKSRYPNHDLSLFRSQLAGNINQMAQDYLELYSERIDAWPVFYNTILEVLSHWLERPQRLRARDAQKLADPDLYNSHSMIGASCYIDLFAGDIQGMIGKIDYLKSLGITYLYILPPFKVPKGANDGGFAVSDYKTIRPDLGTMQDMARFIEKCHENGIDVVLDFVLNHTADDHEWALKAKAGDPEFEDFYMFFDDENEVKDILKTVEATFPDKGENIVFNPAVNRWVWTTFNLYQWDLNYRNPKVLAGMLDNVLFLGNIGVDVLRLDAISLVWKEKGTNCKSLPQIQTLVRLFSALTKLAAPCLQFKSEAIVKPQEVREYVNRDSATVAYRPLLSSTLWHALACGNATLLATSMERWSELSENCTWINYIRSHDDVPWVFSDLDIQYTGSDAAATKRFLDSFYSGEHPDSFAKGLPFQRDKYTQLARISGTTASLAGLEFALQKKSAHEVNLAVQRIVLLHGVFLSVGGLPLIYLGDEVGVLNDYAYVSDPAKHDDSRWVNRPAKDWANDTEATQSPSSPAFRIFHALRHMIGIRKNEQAFSGAGLKTLNLGSPSIYGYRRGSGKDAINVIANFSPFAVDINPHYLKANGIESRQFDLLGTQSMEPADGISLLPYQILWLKTQ